MTKFLIQGSCNGEFFSETVEAPDGETAEDLAIERLCEAWGHERERDGELPTTLDDLGDAASVSEYTAEDYARDAAPRLLAALQGLVGWAETMGGWEAQVWRDAKIALAEATGTPTRGATAAQAADDDEDVSDDGTDWPAMFPKSDWQMEVSNGDTSLGYSDWLAGQIAAHKAQEA